MGCLFRMVDQLEHESAQGSSVPSGKAEKMIGSTFLESITVGGGTRWGIIPGIKSKMQAKG